MRRAIAFITSRYGLAGLLALIVVVVVIVARLLGAGSPASWLSSGSGAAPGSAGTGQAGGPNDGVPDSESAAPAPIVKPGQPGPQEVALNCAKAWVAHTGVTADAWWTAVTKYTTQQLAAKLKGVDPQSVPASQVVGEAELGDHNTTWAEVKIKVAPGELTLRVLSGNTGWLVDGIDWARP